MTIYEHTVPVGLLMIALVVALLTGAFSAWKFLPRNWGNLVLGVLYLLALVALAWCALMPGRKDSVTSLLKPRFIVALDTSKSMTLSPSEETSNRWSTAQQALKLQWVRAISSECDVEICPIGSEMREGIPLAEAAGLQPEDASTLLRDGLRQISERYNGLNVAGALLLSDGFDTREAFDDWAADERPFPFYTVRLEPDGEWQKEPDLRIDAVTTSRRVTVGWKSEFKVKISGQGTRDNPVVVQLFENDELVAEKPTRIPDEGGERVLVFELEHPEVGNFTYRTQIPALPDETNTDDNKHITTVQVVDARNRLLYVEGTPRWEYKFLRRVLMADKQVTPIVFYTDSEGKPVGGTGDITADMSPPELALCKIVVIGDLDAKELGPGRAANLVKFVEEGGSLVLLGGRKGWGQGGFFQTDIGKILPIRAGSLKPEVAKDPFAVSLTDAARSHPAFAGSSEFWAVVPPVLSVFSGAGLSQGAQVLVNAEAGGVQVPMVVSQRYGQGKVTTVLTDSLWRWQLGPEAAENKPYQRFWTQMISWLLPQEEDLAANQLELFADRDQVYFGEELELHARIGGDQQPGGDGVQCRITLPDERELKFPMNAGQVTTPTGKSFEGFSLPFTPETAGSYKAVAIADVGGNQQVSEAVSFYVQPFSPETMPRPINAKVLETIAVTSGGRFFDNLDQLNNELSALQLNSIEEESAEFYTLWRRWPVIVILMLLLAAAWGLRKLRNMP